MANWRSYSRTEHFSRPQKRDFRPFRATVSMKNVWSILFRKRSTGKFGSVRHFFAFFSTKTRSFLHDNPIYLMSLKTQNVHSFQARVPICQFLAENVVRHGRIRHFLVQKNAPLAVGTPICQIVPVSRAYPPPPQKKIPS